MVYGDASLRQTLPGTVKFVEVTRLPAAARKPGQPSAAGGQAQLKYLDAVIEAVHARAVEGVCTAPVSKAAISKTGTPFVGHTEYLAHAFRVPTLMLFWGPTIHIALATTHVPLAEVSQLLTPTLLRQKLDLLSNGLRRWLGRRPNIAVLGLNPHAGEGGTLGMEEMQTIAPAVRRARARGIRCSGPFPADGFFSQRQALKQYDVAIAMFHDQGLVAAKTMDFSRTVNVTIGLPFLRTSPDHGVAYDIAGKNRADCTPFASALALAGALTARSARSPTR